MILLVLAFVQIGAQYAQTGDFVNKGVSLKGGSTVTLVYEPGMDIAAIETELLSRHSNLQVSVRELASASGIAGIVIDSAAQSEAELAPLFESLDRLVPNQAGDYSVEIVGSSLGESFFKQTAIALLVAFVLMGLIVFMYFRSPIPSLTVVASAFSDIVITLAIFNLTGIKLTTAGVAAFLMIIGYSVDTDILLNTRLVKRREGTPAQRVYDAMRTGFTMTGTTLIVLLMGIVFVESEIVKQIMIILFIGLLVDTLMTWVFNVGVLRWYLARRGQK